METKETEFKLPGKFPHGGRYVEELRMMARFVYCQREQIRKWLSTPEAAEKLIAEYNYVSKLFEEEEIQSETDSKNNPNNDNHDGPNGEDLVADFHHKLNRIVYLVEKTEKCTEYPDLLTGLGDDLRDIVSSYNLHVRLHTSMNDKEVWPRPNLVEMEKSFVTGIINPQTPAEYVHPYFAGSDLVDHQLRETGRLQDKQLWLGHGLFYYQRPSQLKGKIVNTGGGGDTNANFDVMEDGFVRLKKAKILYANYNLLQKDFATDLKDKSNQEIDQWLLENAAYISAGQVRRFDEGGDHHELLGINKMDGGVNAVVDVTTAKTGIRMRAGGRAATLFAGDTYSFRENGSLKAKLIDIKGIGTHKDVASKKVSHSGLLGKTDALRGLAVQLLIQRICELEGEQDNWNTIGFYALIDTGLKYADGVADPATGVKGEMCVLSLRQAQSRLAGIYDSWGDFAAGGGNMLLAGDTQKLCASGNGRRIRAALEKYKLSAEIVPSIWIDQALGTDRKEHLDCVDSMWNLQADAAVTHFMDFSNYFVFGDDQCPLHKDWWMLDETLLVGHVMDRNSSKFSMDTILGYDIGSKGWDAIQPEEMKAQSEGLPDLMEKLFKTRDQKAALTKFKEEWKRISKTPKYRHCCANNMITVDGTPSGARCDRDSNDGYIVRSTRTIGCQNWFMELDVMTGPIWVWAGRWNSEYEPEIALTDKIEQWLPKKKA